MRACREPPLAGLTVVAVGSIVLGVGDAGPDALDVTLPDASTARCGGSLPTRLRPDPVEKEVTR
jgi:hypothetical protein